MIEKVSFKKAIEGVDGWHLFASIECLGPITYKWHT